MINKKKFFIGCAGWSVSQPFRGESKLHHLTQYAEFFNCVEINSSFYRLHQPVTYKKWASLVPETFRFSAKIPKTISHETKLQQPELIKPFLEGIRQLKEKPGPLLLQLPPSFKFDEKIAADFLKYLTQHHNGPIVCEPRHETWFSATALSCVLEYNITLVAADPAALRVFSAEHLHSQMAYARLHGAPRTYYSEYSNSFLHSFAEQIKELPFDGDIWIIFDNTALGHAFLNARELHGLVDCGVDVAVSQAWI